MPTDEAELRQKLDTYVPFLSAMYTEQDEAIFGPVNFILDHWLFLWDTGAGYFLTKHDENGELIMVAMLTQFRDLWSARPRLEIHRVALANRPELDPEAEVYDIIHYLKSVANLMRFDIMYYTNRDSKGNEIKEIVWNGRT